jgi:hypothetical protein
LRNVGFYGCAVGGTVGECLDYGHGDPSWWSDEHVGGSEQCWWYGSMVRNTMSVKRKCELVAAGEL